MSLCRTSAPAPAGTGLLVRGQGYGCGDAELAEPPAQPWVPVPGQHRMRFICTTRTQTNYFPLY